MPIAIREERPDDSGAIRNVVTRACGPDEAELVDALRANGAVTLSLVAVLEGDVVGHILYSPITVGDSPVVGAALGPMCVAPELQRRGIGSSLVGAGTQALNDVGCPFVVVLGHRDYYPRFGFRPARARGIDCRWRVPDDVFMALVLDESRMNGVSGMARYREEFSRFE